MKVVRTCLAVAIAGLISIGSVAAQQSAPPPSEQERAKTPEPVSGELVSIAMDTKTLVVKTSGSEQRMQTADPLADLNRIAATSTIDAFQMERPTLEQVFLRLTGRSLRD